MSANTTTSAGVVNNNSSSNVVAFYPTTQELRRAVQEKESLMPKEDGDSSVPKKITNSHFLLLRAHGMELLFLLASAALWVMDILQLNTESVLPFLTWFSLSCILAALSILYGVYLFVRYPSTCTFATETEKQTQIASGVFAFGQWFFSTVFAGRLLWLYHYSGYSISYIQDNSFRTNGLYTFPTQILSLSFGYIDNLFIFNAFYLATFAIIVYYRHSKVINKDE